MAVLRSLLLVLGSIAFVTVAETAEIVSEGEDPDFDCSWRKLAVQYAVKLRPTLSSELDKAVQLHDALQLTSLCNVSFGETAHELKRGIESTATPISPMDFRSSFFVHAAHGKDSNTGTVDAPFATIAISHRMPIPKRYIKRSKYSSFSKLQETPHTHSIKFGS